MKIRITGIGKEIVNSVNERSKIQAVINNTNQSKRYAKYCLKNHKENPKQCWDIIAQNSLTPEYKKLLEVEPLANKYKELWQEKYYKCKLQCEKILGI